MERSACCGLVMISLAASIALEATPAAGQWRFDVQAGQLHYEGVTDATTTTIAFGLTHATPVSSYGVTAGVPFSSEEPVWAALNGYRRLATPGALRFGVDLAGNAFGYRIAARDSTLETPLFEDDQPVTGWGASAEVMPLVAWDAGRFAGEARAGVVGFTTASNEVETSDRAAFLAEAMVQARFVPALTARVDGRWVQAAEGGFPYAGIGLVWEPGATLWASVGRWFDVDSVLTWNVGASLPLGDRLSLVVTGAGDPLDPIYATPERTTWSLGLSVWLGAGRPSIAEPVPASYVDGIASIILEAGEVRGTPSVAGDFNAWTPAPMERSGDDWVLRIPLEPGVYNYAFVDEAGNWFVPEDTPGRRNDGMGGYVAVLVVGE